MSCSDCNSKDGCSTRKGVQRGVLDEVIDKIYPDRTWGRPDDEARFRAGISRGEAKRLGRALSVLTKAPTFFREGAAEDLCDFVYVLCVGREPSLLDVRDGIAAAPADLPDGGKITEKYLRVCFSTVARVAAQQEVTLTLESGRGMVVEEPRAGVWDPILLKRVRSVVALLEASSIGHIDFGLLDVPLAESAPGDYAERYGVEPRLANFLFFAAPPTTQVITPIDLSSLSSLSSL